MIWNSLHIEGDAPPYLLRRKTVRTEPYRVVAPSISYCNSALLSLELPSYNNPAKMWLCRTQGVFCYALFWSYTRSALQYSLSVEDTCRDLSYHPPHLNKIEGTAARIFYFQ